MLCPPGLYMRCGTYRKNNFPECLPSIPARVNRIMLLWQYGTGRTVTFLIARQSTSKFKPEVAIYDAGLAKRPHDLVGGMFEMELATMFGGYGLMNGHMCFFIWGDQSVIGSERPRQMRLPTSRMSARWI